MTIATTTSRVSFAGNGSTTVFSFPYYFLANADLVVVLRVDSTGVETVQTLTTHYTVTGATSPSGGTVTMLTAPPTGRTLIIYRAPAAKQEVDWVENDNSPAETLERSLDLLTMLAQRLTTRIDRAARLTEGYSSSFDPQLPPLMTAGSTIIVNATANGFEEGPTATEIENAEDDAAAAAASASAAATSAAAALTAEANAELAETNAETAEANAELAETNAETAEANAEAAQAAAEAAQAAAEAAQAAAELAETNAETAETNAETAETNAETAEANAETAEANAETAQAAAELAEDNAAASAAASAASAVASAASAAATFGQDVVYKVFADSPVTVLDADKGKLFVADCTGGVIVFNLPQISGLTLSASWVIGIKKSDSSTNGVTINAYNVADGTNTIDGSNSKTLLNQHAGCLLLPDTDKAPDQWDSINTGFSNPMTTTGDIIYSSSGSTPARLGIGSSGQVLKVTGGVPVWAAAPSGGINYLAPNHDAEVDTTGWSTYADAAGVSPVDGTGGSPNTTWTRTTSTPLRGSGSYLWTKASGASRQGEGVSFPFAIDSADAAKPIAINFDYIIASGTFTASDGITAPANSGTTVTAGNSTVAVFVYDVTNAVLIPVSPSVLTSNSTTTPSTFKGVFQTASNSTSYRLILHTSYVTDAAMTAKFDNFYVGPDTAKALLGPPVTDWVAYTPTGTWSTNTTYTGYYRRVGDTLEVKGKIALAGAPTSATLTINLPTGFSIDTNKLITSSGGQNSGLGRCTANDNGVKDYAGLVIYSSATVVQLTIENVSGSTLSLGQINATTPFTFGNTDGVDWEFSVPIAGWSSTTQMSNDTDTRVVAFKAATQATGSITSTYTDTVIGTVVQDTHGAYATGTGIYTIPVSGTYAIAGQAIIGGTYALNGDARMQIYKNGATSLAVGLTRAGGANNVLCVGVNAIASLVAGDTIRLQSLTSATGPNYDSTAGATFFTVNRLSGPATIAASESVTAKYYCSANKAPGANGIVDFDSKLFDSHSAVTTGASWKFRAPSSGKYQVNLNWNQGSATAFNSYLYINGVATESVGGSSNGNGLSFAGSTLVNLLAGDYIDIRPSAAGTFAGGAIPYLSYITVNRVGN